MASQATAPVVAAYGAVVNKREGNGRRLRTATIVAAASIAVVCGVLAAMHSSAEGVGSQALAGAYYAVAKPPAFNFNRESPSRLHGSRTAVASAGRYFRGLRWWALGWTKLNHADGALAAPLLGAAARHFLPVTHSRLYSWLKFWPHCEQASSSTRGSTPERPCARRLIPSSSSWHASTITSCKSTTSTPSRTTSSVRRSFLRR